MLYSAVMSSTSFHFELFAGCNCLWSGVCRPILHTILLLPTILDVNQKRRFRVVRLFPNELVENDDEKEDFFKNLKLFEVQGSRSWKFRNFIFTFRKTLHSTYPIFWEPFQFFSGFQCFNGAHFKNSSSLRTTKRSWT